MIKENLNIVKAKIAEACVRSGRKTDEITLVAVSKTKPIDMIEEAIENGVTDFGENKAQEFRDKFEILGSKANWHFIGHLQTNKVKYVVGKAKLIHSVESEKLASEINKRAEKLGVTQNILLEMNTSGEESKFGLNSLTEAENLLEFCSGLLNVKVLGLMTMAPFTDGEKLIRSSFSELRGIRNSLEAKGYDLPHLSMGMTNDYEIAIEEGSTIVRIGTAIFGARNYSVNGSVQ